MCWDFYLPSEYVKMQCKAVKVQFMNKYMYIQGDSKILGQTLTGGIADQNKGFNFLLSFANAC